MISVALRDDYLVAESFRWQGILYEKDSVLPADMNAAAITRFMHRTPPLLKLKSASPNGAKPAARKKSRKKAKKKAKKKKTSRR
jgi:hypothetical protein